MFASLRFLSLTACMIGVAVSGAQAQGSYGKQHPNVRSKPVPNWYLGLAASVNYVQDASVTEQGTVPALNGTMSFDDSYGLSGAIGYRPRNNGNVLDHMRFEVEMGYRDSDLGTYSDNALGISNVNDSIQVQTIMANVYADLGTGAWRPYVGAGVGMARVFADTQALGIDDEDTVLAYQGMAGLYYTIPSLQAVELGVGYRYLGTSNPEFTTNRGTLLEIEYDAHIVEAGARLYF